LSQFLHLQINVQADPPFQTQLAPPFTCVDTP
jgi:hypothetical protein